jgi:hypothetical protein
VLLLFVSGKASGVPARAGLERPSDRRGKAVAAPAAYVDYSAPSNSLEDPPARERISESAGDPLAILEGRRMSGGLAFRFLPFPEQIPNGFEKPDHIASHALLPDISPFDPPFACDVILLQHGSKIVGRNSQDTPFHLDQFRFRGEFHARAAFLFRSRSQRILTARRADSRRSSGL